MSEIIQCQFCQLDHTGNDQYLKRLVCPGCGNRKLQSHCEGCGQLACPDWQGNCCNCGNDYLVAGID